MSDQNPAETGKKDANKTARRTTAQGWTLVQVRRREWRGEFDGVFLGEQDGKWMAGRQYLGKSMRDGFGPDGEWWYATYFDYEHEHEAYRARRALAEYIRLSEAIDRHWANRVSLDGVYDMSTDWVFPGLTGDVAGMTYMLPASEAKYELLQYMRRSYSVQEAFREADQGRTSPELPDAFDAAISAVGPLAVTVGGARYRLSYEGRYNDTDERWRREWRRNPHPDRKGN
jgi:hypothetical protein